MEEEKNDLLIGRLTSFTKGSDIIVYPIFYFLYALKFLILYNQLLVF